MSKLYSYGLNDETIQWIAAFLQERTQCVKINSAISKSKPVLSGIPQGSVLGPLLFIIYINDLPSVCQDFCNIFLFADDAKLYKCITNQLDADTLNMCFKNLLAWSDNWLMKLNISKCNVLSLQSNKNNIAVFNYISSDSVTLGRVDNIKDLGVTMSSNLSFKEHIHEKINTAYRLLGIIRRNFSGVDVFTFITLYKSFVRSHLEYANSAWNPCSMVLIRDIEKVQKRATKHVLSCKHMAYKQRLEYLHLPTLKYRRLRGDMIEVYKIMHELYEPAIVPLLKRNLDIRTRGNSLKLLVERCNTDIGRFSFCHRVVKCWNMLPDSVVNSASLNNFKANIDKHFKDHDIYYDFEAEL